MLLHALHKLVELAMLTSGFNTEKRFAPNDTSTYVNCWQCWDMILSL